MAEPWLPQDWPLASAGAGKFGLWPLRISVPLGEVMGGDGANTLRLPLALCDNLRAPSSV